MIRYLRIVALIALCMMLGESRLVGAPMSTRPVQVTTTGFIDPTVSTFNSSHPMRCTADIAPGSTFTEQNRATLLAAITLASSTKKWIYLPRCLTDSLDSDAPCPSDDSCGYPISKSTSQCGVDFSGLSDITIIGGYGGSVLRMAGNLSSSSADYFMLCLRQTSNVKLLGLTFSARDLTATGGTPSEHTHMILIGDGNTKAADLVTIADSSFKEVPTVGGGGDCIDSSGGATAINQRVNIINNLITGCHRDSVDFQRGYQHYNIVGNHFVADPGTNQMIDNETTSNGVVGQTYIAYNFFDGRAAATKAHMSLSGYGEQYRLDGVNVNGNVMIEAYPGPTINNARIWFTNNRIVMAEDPGGGAGTDPMVYFTRRSEDIWIAGNYFWRGPTGGSDKSMIEIGSQPTNCISGGPTCKPSNVWVMDNTMHQSKRAVGATFGSTHDVWVTGNRYTYHGATDGSITLTTGLAQFAASDFHVSGWVYGNDVIRGLQADDDTLSGKLYAAVIMTEGNTSSKFIGHMTIAENLVDGGSASGTLNTFYNNSSSSAYTDTEGRPVITNNQLIDNGTTFMGGGRTAFVAEKHRVERFSASGTMSPDVDFADVAGNCGAESFTLANGTYDGFLKHVKIHSACVSTGTLTPASFGDGSTIMWSTTIPDPSFEFDLVWDETGAKWWILNNAGVTVNP